MKRLWTGLLILVLAGCGDWMTSAVAPVRPWQETHELVVLVPNGPTTLFVDASGGQAGLEYDLVNQFAAKHALKVRFVVAANQADALTRLRRGEAHMAAGVWASNEPNIVNSPVYQTVEPVLVYLSGSSDSEIQRQLAAGKLPLNVLPEHIQTVAKIKARWPGLVAVQDMAGDGEDLFERVAQGKIRAALIDARTAEVMQNYYPQVAILYGVSEPMALAWALRSDDADLTSQVSAFMKEATAQGVVTQLASRYYGHINRLEPLDASAFLNRRSQILPDFRGWFHEAAAKTGLDWRLVAALAYQESHWNPTAVSPTGVRGLMMLTAGTAQALGVDRMNPYQSIMGGARYMRQMIDMIPQRITEPDRTWLALAAYNVGFAHLEDARILAQRLKKNPDSWVDVKSVLPLLRNPRYFQTLKNGYARGGEPVIFVESLRTYFDILARFEPPMEPSTTQLASTSAEPETKTISPAEPSLVGHGEIAAL
ncbi:MAG: membrane-bound lytic murein transglycosylase MltF [Formivibrio sp.]|nr:membrane-bound lytic murein transglycosylase MltF [Formivibrio sp.]